MPRVRIRKAVECSLVLLLWLAISAEAHVGDRVFPIAELTDEMLEQIQLDDGRIDEWYELVGEPSMTLLDFKEEWENLEPDPSDLDFRIWLAWHDDPARIYVAFVAGDDLYKNTHDYSGDWFESSTRDDMMDHDSIMMGFDGDHSGGAGCTSSCSLEADWPEAHGQTQWYEAIARTVGGPTLDDPGVRHQTGEFPWTVFPPYGDGGGGVAGEAPVISVIELYVTPFDHWGGGWSSAGDHLVSDLAAGKVIGFAIIVHDRDPPGRWRGWVPEAMHRSDGSVFGELWDVRGDTFVDGILLPAGSPQPGDSAVESVSWGRIKAALEME